MADRFQALHEATLEAVLRGPGTLSAELRQAVARGEAPVELRALVTKIRERAYSVTDADLAELAAGYTEDQLFELVVAATLGAADERLRAGLRALDEAS